MRVLIVEEALKSLHGHWFQYISDIVKGGVEAGHEIEVAVHKDASIEILNAFRCHPVLTKTVFERHNITKGKWHAIKRVIAHNYSLYNDLSKLLKREDSFDVIIATTPTLDHILAYWFLFWRFRNIAFRRLVLIFIHIVGKYSSDGSQLRFALSSLPLRCAMWFLRPLLRTKQFFLITESEGLAHQIKLFCGIMCPLVPHVTAAPVYNTEQIVVSNKERESQNKYLLLGTYGFTRYDKGVDLFQSAITLIKKNPKKLNLRFVMQWMDDYQLPNGSWARKDPLLINDPTVQYLNAFSSSNQYYEWLRRTDIMVLPYRRGFYRDKLSRVAIDGVLSGMPFVYPIGTWLETLANKYGTGVPFEPENPESLADAIRIAAINYDVLKHKAISVQAAASNDFSARAFFNEISNL